MPESLIFKKTSAKCMQDFSVEWIRQMFGGPFIEGRDKILLLGEAQKFGVIFWKFVLKLVII